MRKKSLNDLFLFFSYFLDDLNALLFLSLLIYLEASCILISFFFFIQAQYTELSSCSLHSPAKRKRASP